MIDRCSGIIVAPYEDELTKSGGQSRNITAARKGKQLARDAGGPIVRAVVLLDNQAPVDPLVVTRYPRLVIRMFPAAALAYSITHHSERVLVVSALLPVPDVTAFWRTPAGLHGTKLNLKDAGELTAAARLLDAQQIFFVTDIGKASHLPAGTKAQVASEAQIYEGAIRYASTELDSQGVTHSGRRSGVSTQRRIGYPVLRPERGVFDLDESSLGELVGSSPVLLVCDRKVAAIHLDAWRRYAQRHLNVSGEYLADGSESAKTWDQVHEICSAAATCGLPRNGVVIGIGGGATLDVAGVAASIFRRGVRYVRIPTSLVGLVDVSVGIKQGVNAYGRKNLLGSFYPPLASINDYRFLGTLPACEISNGIAEIVKIALLRDPDLLELLEDHGAELLASRFGRPAHIAKEITLRAELLMLEELAPNLFEDELLRLVDFGHTFSPALEQTSDYRLSHGKAVALDMLLSSALAVVLGSARVSLLNRLVRLFLGVGLPLWDERMPRSIDLLHALEDIKRHRGGRLNLIVVIEPGCPEVLSSVSRPQLDAALDLLLSYTPAVNVETIFAERVYERAAV